MSEIQVHNFWPSALLIIPHYPLKKRKCHKFALVGVGVSQLCCQSTPRAAALETGCGNDWMWRLPYAHGSPSSLFLQGPARQAGWGEQSSILLPSPSPTSSLRRYSVSGSPSWGRGQRLAQPRPVPTPTLASQHGASGSL